jgi:TolB protein
MKFRRRFFFLIPILLAVMIFPAACSSPAATGTVVPPSTLYPTETCKGILCTPVSQPQSSSDCNCEPGDISATPLSAADKNTLTPSASAFAALQFTPPSLLSQQGMLAMAVHANGHANLWLWPMGLANPIQITADATDDRDPAFRPDGGAIAFASERGGNWDLYILDLSSGQVESLTSSPEFEGHPSWSPDSRQMVYEHYTNGHFGINIRRVEDKTLMWQGPSGMDSMEPDWSPLARSIAFTGRTGTHTDIYVFNLDTQTITDLTNTPDLDERDSAFSPDGKSLAYSVEQNGYTWIYTLSIDDPSKKPTLIGQGAAPEWSPDGKWIQGTAQPDLLQSYLLFSPSVGQSLSPAALWISGRVDRVAWTSAVLPNPVPGWILPLASTKPASTSTLPPAGTPLSAQLVTVDVNAPDPRLSSAVLQRFQALRAAVKQQAGWDFLGTLDSAAIGIDTPMPPKETLSWLRTGRAFAVSRAAVSKGWLVVVPDPAGPQDYWRLFVRAAEQDGSQGEPLRYLPWDFDARTSGTPSALDSGGRFYPDIPAGYYIDFTQLAAEFGFGRIASEPDWRTYYFGINFWEFVCADGLDWSTAMDELYPPSAFITPTPTFTLTPWWYQPSNTPKATPTPTTAP